MMQADPDENDGGVVGPAAVVGAFDELDGRARQIALAAENRYDVLVADDAV
jgi:hypothetical protein